MKIIKTELRNKMGNDWLNHRMICYIEREIFASIEDDDILYHWQDLKNRLQKLPPHRSKSSNASGKFHIQISGCHFPLFNYVLHIACLIHLKFTTSHV
jgi:hypothetical protein